MATMPEGTYYTGVLASAAGANKRHLALFNTAGSGALLTVYKVTAAPAPTIAVTGLTIALHAMRITSAPTGGSSLLIGKADSLVANPPAQIVGQTGATGGAAESGPPFGVGTVSGEETQSGQFAELYIADIKGVTPVTCREGEGIVVKQGALASAGAVNLMVTFRLS